MCFAIERIAINSNKNSFVNYLYVYTIKQFIEKDNIQNNREKII